MKYLLLIIRHLFPKRIWKNIGETSVLQDGDPPGSLPIARYIIQQDQFGNLRRFKRTP